MRQNAGDSICTLLFCAMKTSTQWPSPSRFHQRFLMGPDPHHGRRDVEVGRDARSAALDAHGGAGLLVRDQCLPGGGHADPGVPGDRRAAGFGRQGGQDGPLRGCRPPPG